MQYKKKRIESCKKREKIIKKGGTQIYIYVNERVVKENEK